MFITNYHIKTIANTLSVNGIILIFFSDYDLLDCGSIIDLCVWSLYPDTLLNSFISFCSFFMDSLGFFYLQAYIINK